MSTASRGSVQPRASRDRKARRGSGLATPASSEMMTAESMGVRGLVARRLR